MLSDKNNIYKQMFVQAWMSLKGSLCFVAISEEQIGLELLISYTKINTLYDNYSKVAYLHKAKLYMSLID